MAESPFTDINIRTDLKPGDLGRLISFHGVAYEGEDNHFGIAFEAYVARTIADFMIDNHGRGKVWLAERGRDLVATAAMVERRKNSVVHGQLRWILACPSVRGTGLGGYLVQQAIAHARSNGFQSVFLETTDGLDASMALYRKLGFEEESRALANLWSGENTVIMMRLVLGDG